MDSLIPSVVQLVEKLGSDLPQDEKDLCVKYLSEDNCGVMLKAKCAEAISSNDESPSTAWDQIIAMLKKKEPVQATREAEKDDSPKASSQGMTSNPSTDSIDRSAASPTTDVEEAKEEEKETHVDPAPEAAKEAVVEEKKEETKTDAAEEKKDDEVDIDIKEEEKKEEEPSSPASPGKVFFATEADLHQMRKTLCNAEETQRKELKKDEDTTFTAIKKFRESQAKERKVEEDGETAERKKQSKEENDAWNAIMSFWKQQNKDLEKGQKRLISEENDERKKLDKEEQAEFQAIQKLYQTEAKERKQQEDTETAERAKVEKECTAEIDWLVKLRETEAKERKQKEADETNARKNEEKEETNGWQEFLKHSKQVWDAEYLRRRTEKEKEWKADAEAVNCVKCSAKFGLFTRKHHCRACGGVFCDKCTSNRIEMLDIGYVNKERACDECMSKRMVKN